MQPYTQQPLTYQLQTVPVPIVDKTLKQIHTLNSRSKAILSFKYGNAYKC